VVAAIAEVVTVGSIANGIDVQVTVVVVLTEGAVVKDETTDDVTITVR